MCSPIEQLDSNSIETLKDILQNIANKEFPKIGISIANVFIDKSLYGRNTLRVDIEEEQRYYGIASFTISDFPGCPYVAVSIHTYVVGCHQNKGVATILHKMKEAVAEYMHYNTYIATVTEDNTYQKLSLIKNGWNKVDIIEETYYHYSNEAKTRKVGLWTKHFP